MTHPDPEVDEAMQAMEDAYARDLAAQDDEFAGAEAAYERDQASLREQEESQ